jgi:hypothetical protein
MPKATVKYQSWACRPHWRRRAFVRFLANRGQEPYPYQTSSWIYLEGSGKDFGALRRGAQVIRPFRVVCCLRLPKRGLERGFNVLAQESELPARTEE